MRRAIPTVPPPLAAAAAGAGALILAALLLVATKHPVPVLGGLVALCGAVAVIRFPILSLGVLFFVQPFHTALFAALKVRASLDTGALDYWKDALIVALFARAFYERVRSDRRLPLNDAGDNIVWFYILAFIGIALTSPSRPTVGPALALYVEGPLVFLTLRWLRPTRRQLWGLAAAMLSAAAVIGGAALIEQVGPRLAFHRWYGASAGPNGEPFVLPSGAYRSGSFIYDPLILGFYLAAAVPFAVAVATVRSWWRGAAAVAFVACAAGLVVTITRSGYIGGGIGLLVALSLAVRNPGIRASLIGMALVLVGVVSIYYIASNDQSLIRTESNVSHRQSLERDVELLEQRPLGYGLGTTDRFRFRPDAEGQLGATESTYMARALEAGLQGFFLYLVALFSLLMRLRSARLRARRAGDRDGVALAAGAMGSLVAVSLAGLFLGVHELVVEIVLWGAPALALAWPLAERTGIPVRADSASETVPVG